MTHCPELQYFCGYLPLYVNLNKPGSYKTNTPFLSLMGVVSLFDQIYPSDSGVHIAVFLYMADIKTPTVQYGTRRPEATQEQPGYQVFSLVFLFV